MPSSLSEIDIINRALIKIGDQRITSRGDNNNRARIMNDLYEGVRDELLRECPWNFAVNRDTLAADPVAPVYKWATAFDVPADMLYMVSTESNSAYRLEGNQILSNQENSLKITYIRRVTDPTEFDTNFAETLASKLAYEGASNITGDLELQDRLFRDYNLSLIKSKKTDGQEDDPRDWPIDDWDLARSGGSPSGFSNSFE